MYMDICLRVYMTNKHMQELLKVRRKLQIPRKWDYRWLWAAYVSAGKQPRFSARALNIITYWALSPDPSIKDSFNKMMEQWN